MVGYCAPQVISMQTARKAGSSHTLWIPITLKQSKLVSVGEVPYNMLVIFLQLFWLFLFFSLKSTDRHKNPGNATKKKTNVQLRSKNPELRRRRGTGLPGAGGDGRGSPHRAAGHRRQEEGEAARQGAVMLTAAL